MKEGEIEHAGRLPELRKPLSLGQVVAAPIPRRAARSSTTPEKVAFVHSLFTFIGDTDISGRPLVGNRVGCSPLDKVQTYGTGFAVAMALNRSFRLQRLSFCLGLLWFPGTGAQHNTRTRRKPPPRYPVPLPH